MCGLGSVVMPFLSNHIDIVLIEVVMPFLPKVGLQNMNHEI